MRNLALFVLLILLPLNLYAENNVNRKTVEELLEIMNVQSMIDSMNFEIAKMFEGLSTQLNIKENEREIFDYYVNKVNNITREEMTWENLKEPMIQIYMKHYTQKEIDEIVTFYKTDTGKSLIKKMPLVLQESMAVSQNMMQNVYPKIQEVVNELQEKISQQRIEK